MSMAVAPPVDEARLNELRALAAENRRLIVKAIHEAQAGHLGGPLSATDILVALYFDVLRIDPQRPDWPARDRFILSKGHSCIALYAVLALRGYFPVEELYTFDKIDSRLQGHPDMTVLPGLEMSTGSLGQGLSPGVGMALGAKRRGLDFRTYVMLGDGGLQEGQVWEAAFLAACLEPDNLGGVGRAGALAGRGEGGPECPPPHRSCWPHASCSARRWSSWPMPIPTCWCST